MENVEARQTAIFPIFLYRVGAMPADIVGELRDRSFSADLASLHDLESRIAATRNAISELLFEMIGEVEDRNQRRELLNLRRSLFRSDMVPADRAIELAFSVLDSTSRERLKEHLTSLGERQAVLSRLEMTYQRALVQSRTLFKKRLIDEDFRTALQLSSRSLFGNLDTYLQSSDERLSAKLGQIERGLTRYFFRAVTKSTPFARFCSVGIGSIGKERCGQQSLQFTGDPQVKISQVRLNRSLCGMLWERCKRLPVIRSSLSIAVNPTLREEEGRYSFIANVRGREIVQRLAKSAGVDVCVGYLGDGAKMFSHLSAALHADERVEASEAESIAFIEYLADQGLLRYQALVEEQEIDWEERFIAHLNSIDDEQAKGVAKMLEKVVELCTDYAVASSKVRDRIGAQLREVVQEGFRLVGITNPLPKDLPLFEDAATPARMLLRDEGKLSRALRSLANWIEVTECFSAGSTEQATMRHFYEAHYGDTPNVSLMNFYEDFYRNHLREHLRREVEFSQKGHLQSGESYDLGNPFGLPGIQLRREAVARIRTLIQQRWAKVVDSEDIHLSAEDIRNAIGPAGSGGRHDQPRSYAAFCQVVCDARGEPEQFVLSEGKYLPGFGKYFSRFLYLQPIEVTEELRKNNTSLSKGGRLTELCGDANFNANLHPELLESRMSYPTGEDTAATRSYAASDLLVAPNPGNMERLSLVDAKTGEEIWPVDLGFLTQKSRPPFFQLLARFTPSTGFGLRLPETLPPEGIAKRSIDSSEFKESNSEPGKVVYRPRVVFEGGIVIARRRWSVSAGRIPVPEINEKDAEYFLRINAWRRRFQIPDRVYMKVFPVTNGKTDSGITAARHAQGKRGEAAKPSRDWAKPQYICFETPLLIRLLQRQLTTDIPIRIEFEEALPDETQLPNSSGSAWALEMILQVDFREVGSAVGEFANISSQDKYTWEME